MPPLSIDDETASLYTVGQVARILRVRQAFLRRLDEYEIVCPVRSSGGQRRYSRLEIRRVRHVVELASEGMTLIAIRRVLELERRVTKLQAERDAAVERARSSRRYP
ncbi:MAG: helix-turn-helix domain-containing protein [Streptosporangiaceae bacterium]